MAKDGGQRTMEDVASSSFRLAAPAIADDCSSRYSFHFPKKTFGNNKKREQEPVKNNCKQR